MTRGKGGQDAPKSVSFTAATAEAFPAAPDSQAQRPRATAPREGAQGHTRLRSGSSLSQQAAGLRPDAPPVPPLLTAASPTPGRARGLQGIPFRGAHLEFRGLRSSARPGRGKQERPSLTREPETRGQESQLRQKRPRRQGPTSFPTAVCAPAGQPSPTSRHFRHSNSPPMAGPSRGNRPSPASPEDSRDCRAGKARARARARARVVPYASAHYSSYLLRI